MMWIEVVVVVYNAHKWSRYTVVSNRPYTRHATKHYWAFHNKKIVTRLISARKIVLSPTLSPKSCSLDSKSPHTPLPKHALDSIGSALSNQSVTRLSVLRSQWPITQSPVKQWNCVTCPSPDPIRWVPWENVAWSFPRFLWHWECCPLSHNSILSLDGWR